MLNRHRLTVEKMKIDFDTNVHYSYNNVFTLQELKQDIKLARDTSPGIDTVQYQLLKHLPDDSLLLLLYIFNHIWLTQDFPTSWKTVIIIPSPKRVGCFQNLVVTGLLSLLVVYVKQCIGWSTVD